MAPAWRYLVAALVVAEAAHEKYVIQGFAPEYTSAIDAKPPGTGAPQGSSPPCPSGRRGRWPPPPLARARAARPRRRGSPPAAEPSPTPSSLLWTNSPLLMMPALGVRPDRFNERVLLHKGPAAARLQRRRRVLLIKTAAFGERREAVRVAPARTVGVRYAEEPPRAGVAVHWCLRSPPAPALDELGLRVGAGAEAGRELFEGEVGVARDARQVDARLRCWFCRVVFRKEEGVGRALAEPHACSCVGSPRTLVSGADSCADGVALFSLVVAAMAWVPRGPESAGYI